MWKGSQIFFDSSVINPEKLICPGCHVDIVSFALRTFLVHEQIHGVILWLGLNQNDVIVIAEENSNNEIMDIMENAEIDVYKTQLKNTELESVENGRWIAEEKG